MVGDALIGTNLRRAGAWCLAATLWAPGLALADAAQLAEAGCSSCHGPKGVSATATTPSLAGQQPVYVVKQLEEAGSGKRKSEEMQACVSAAKAGDPAALGAYFAALPLPSGRSQNAALAATGKKLFEEGNIGSGVSACVSCHEAGALGSEKHPRLAGQNAEYITKQIRSFKAGARANDKGRQMRNVAVKLSDDEIAAAAEFLSGL
jgi:cytochrome c553